MSKENIILQIAIPLIIPNIPKDLTLEERVKASMEYAWCSRMNIFWMGGYDSDDMIFRAAIGSVLEGCNEEEKRILIESINHVRIIATMMTGILPDISQLDIGEDSIPLIAIYRDIKEANGG